MVPGVFGVGIVGVGVVNVCVGIVGAGIDLPAEGGGGSK